MEVEEVASQDGGEALGCWPPLMSALAKKCVFVELLRAETCWKVFFFFKDIYFPLVVMMSVPTSLS